MKHLIRILCAALALSLACASFTACGTKKNDDNTASAASGSEMSIDDQIDAARSMLESAKKDPAIIRKSQLEIVKELLDQLAERTDLTSEQKEQINKLLDEAAKELKEVGDIDLNDPDLSVSDIMG